MTFTLYFESHAQITVFASAFVTLKLSGKNLIVSFKSDDIDWGNGPMVCKAIPLNALTVSLELNLFVILSVFGNRFRTYSLNSRCDIFGSTPASFVSNSNEVYRLLVLTRPSASKTLESNLKCIASKFTIKMD